MLNEISAYLDEALRRELAGVVLLATVPGPRTLHLKPAITAAAGKEMVLKAYQCLPITFIATMGKKGTGAVLAVEYEMQDSSTGEVVGAGMREGTGRLGEGCARLRQGGKNQEIVHFLSPRKWRCTRQTQGITRSTS